MYRNNEKTLSLYCLVSPAPSLKKPPKTKKTTKQQPPPNNDNKNKKEQINETEIANSYIPDLGI